jgi:hypothetical protein
MKIWNNRLRKRSNCMMRLKVSNPHLELIPVVV